MTALWLPGAPLLASDEAHALDDVTDPNPPTIDPDPWKDRTVPTVTHSEKCPQSLLGESAKGACLCPARPLPTPPPMPAPRTGSELMRPGRWVTMVELKASLAEHHKAWVDARAWAETQKVTVMGARRVETRPKWSAADLKCPNRLVIDAYLKAGCPDVEAKHTYSSKGGSWGGHAEASRLAGAASTAATRVTASGILADHGLSWETVREWGRQEGGMPCDHTKPGRPSLRCVQAYLKAHPELTKVAS